MFSIIVPSYNRKEEIPALLDSLTKQTTYNFDVVIVDDCSKEPVEVTQSYPFAVKVIRNETNQGAAESRNIGARNADNEWLLFLDDDDRFANDKCQKLADVIAEHADVNFVYHPAKCEMVNEVRWIIRLFLKTDLFSPQSSACRRFYSPVKFYLH